jgi:hypothetical protein
MLPLSSKVCQEQLSPGLLLIQEERFIQGRGDKVMGSLKHVRLVLWIGLVVAFAKSLHQFVSAFIAQNTIHSLSLLNVSAGMMSATWREKVAESFAYLLLCACFAYALVVLRSNWSQRK